MTPRNETELLAATIDLAMHCRWACMHPRPALTAHGYRTAITGHKGFPDLVLARTGVVWFWELKSDRTKPTSEQRDWGVQLGDQYRLLRPVDWEWIQGTLTSKPGWP